MNELFSWSWEHATSVLGGATVCLMRICDYKFAVYGFFAEHNCQSLVGFHVRERATSTLTMSDCRLRSRTQCCFLVVKDVVEIRTLQSPSDLADPFRTRRNAEAARGLK